MKKKVRETKFPSIKEGLFGHLCKVSSNFMTICKHSKIHHIYESVRKSGKKLESQMKSSKRSYFQWPKLLHQVFSLMCGNIK